MIRGTTCGLCFVLIAAIARPAVTTQDPPPFLTSFGPFEIGGPWGPSEFSFPYAIARDSTGNLYVTDIEVHRIQKFDRWGTFLGMWGRNGGASGQFDQPWGIAVSAKDEVFVADTFNHRIQVFDTNGKFLLGWGSKGSGPGQFYEPASVAVSGGEVFVADLSNFRIQVFDETGNYLREWTWQNMNTGRRLSPRGICVGPSGDVFTVENGGRLVDGDSCVKRWTPAGSLVALWGDWDQQEDDGNFQGPWQIGAGADGTIYVTDEFYQSLQAFTSTGGFLYRTKERGDGTPFSTPYGVIADPSGVVHVVDYYSFADSILLYGDAPFSLAADFDTMSAGDRFTLRTFAGEPDHFALLFLLDVNGVPLSQVLWRATLNAAGSMELETTVPNDPALPGLTLGLATFSTNATGKVIVTNRETVTFQ